MKVNTDSEYLETLNTDGKKYVSEFSAISVREKNTQSMVQKLLNRKVPVTLDPTLMLNQSAWEKMVSNASLHISEPYILVYVLKYSFNHSF